MHASPLKCAAAGVLLLLAAAIAPAQSIAKDAHWVAAWAAAMDSPGPALPAQTLRQIVRPSIAGSSVRIRLSNLFGTAPLTLGAVHLARRADGSAIQPASDHVVTFGGKPVVTLAKGDAVLSDPVALPVAAFEELAISVYLPHGAATSTIHSVGNQTVYIVPARDMTAAAALPAGDTDDSRYFLSDVEVAAGADARVIVALGDSITDGVGSTEERNARWPDALAARLQADPKLAAIAVVNAGVAGNRILNDADKPYRGPSTLNRFDRDALDKPGIRWIVLLQGGNDISAGEVLTSAKAKVSAEQIIQGMKTLIERAHAKGVKVIGATLLPKGGTTFPKAPSPAAEAKRQAVNAWIRGGGAFDAVVDFERVMRDPAQPDRLLPAYDSGDHLHPNDDGYRAMAAAIDLGFLKREQR